MATHSGHEVKERSTAVNSSAPRGEVDQRCEAEAHLADRNKQCGFAQEPVKMSRTSVATASCLMSDITPCQRRTVAKGVRVQVYCGLVLEAKMHFQIDWWKLLQWCGPAPVSTGDEIAAVKEKVLNIPVNLPCDPHPRAAVCGGWDYKYKRLKWASKRWLGSASGRALRSNRNQHSSMTKRKQIRHLLRVSREVVGESPARRRPCGTARTWWIDYSFHPGLDHLVKKRDSGASWNCLLSDPDLH